MKLRVRSTWALKVPTPQRWTKPLPSSEACAFYLFIRDASWTERMVCRRGLLGVVDQVQETERDERRGTQTGQFGRFIAENPHTQLIGGKLKHPERALPGPRSPVTGRPKEPESDNQALASRVAGLCLLFIHPRAPNLISLRSAGTMPA